jgi:uncharacterized protein (TIGR02147 family)
MHNPGFSYQVFAHKAGIPNKGFLYNVITGLKNLSKSSAVKLAQAMGLGASESDFFENLVSFNQAKNLRERNYFFEKLCAIKSTKSGSALVRELRAEQYEFYSTWFFSAIRSLIDMHPFVDEFAWLAKSVYPPIKPLDAKKAITLLQKLGMIRKGEKGRLEVVDKTITAGEEVVQLGLLNFQKQTAELALKAIEEMPKDKRNISGMTLGISRKTYDLICQEIRGFQSRLQKLAEVDTEADNVYQFNFQFFPISNVNGIVTGRQGWHGSQK